MNYGDLKTKCMALAPAGDDQAKATLEALDYWERREKTLLQEISDFQDIGREAESKFQNARYALAKIALTVDLAREIGILPRREPPTSADLEKIAATLNRCRSKSKPMEPKAEKIIPFLDKLIDEFGERGLRIAFLEMLFTSFFGAVPATPPGFQPGMTPATGVQPVEMTTPANNGEPVNIQDPGLIFANPQSHQEVFLLKPDGTAVILPPEAVGQAIATIHPGRIARTGFASPAERLASAASAFVGGVVKPGFGDGVLDSESQAVAATRAAQGLPPQTDPAVISNTPGDTPAGHTSRENKMGDAAANKGD